MPSKFYIGFNIITLVLIKCNVMCIPWNLWAGGHTARGWKGGESCDAINRIQPRSEPSTQPLIWKTTQHQFNQKLYLWINFNNVKPRFLVVNIFGWRYYALNCMHIEWYITKKYIFFEKIKPATKPINPFARIATTKELSKGHFSNFFQMCVFWVAIFQI